MQLWGVTCLRNVCVCVCVSLMLNLFLDWLVGFYVRSPDDCNDTSVVWAFFCFGCYCLILLSFRVLYYLRLVILLELFRPLQKPNPFLNPQPAFFLCPRPRFTVWHACCFLWWETWHMPPFAPLLSLTLLWWGRMIHLNVVSLSCCDITETWPATRAIGAFCSCDFQHNPSCR